MKLFLSLLALALLVSTVQAAALSTIQLRNRPAAEIIPIVKPMLGANDVISGHGFKIFLRSSAVTLAEVKDMIETLDTAAKNLQISVFQGNARRLKALGLSGTIRFKNGAASGNINGSSTNIRLQDRPIHQLRVSEGSEGYIETGKQIPFFSGGQRIATGDRNSDISYQNITTGFYVLPRVHGDNVTLKISPFKNSQSKSGGKIDTQHANTTITGRIGDWLLIGGATEQVTRSQRGIGGYNSIQSRSDASIWIKADLIQ